jgi:hypothetical protein
LADGEITHWHHLENENPSPPQATVDWQALVGAPLPILDDDGDLLPNELFANLLAALVVRMPDPSPWGHEVLRRLCARSGREGPPVDTRATLLSINAELDALLDPEVGLGDYRGHLQNILRFVDPRAALGDPGSEDFAQRLEEIVSTQEVFARAGFVTRGENGEALADGKEVQLYESFRRGLLSGLARESLAATPAGPAPLTEDGGSGTATADASAAGGGSSGASLQFAALVFMVLATLICGAFGGYLIKKHQSRGRPEPSDEEDDHREADDREDDDREDEEAVTPEREVPATRVPINETFKNAFYLGLEKAAKSDAKLGCRSLILETVQDSMTASNLPSEEPDKPSEETLRWALSAGGTIAGLLSGQMERLHNDLDRLTRTATELGMTLKRATQADPDPAQGSARRGPEDSGTWVNLEDPEVGPKLRKLLHAHYKQLGFMSRDEVHAEVHRLLNEVADKPPEPQARQGMKSEAAGRRIISIEEFLTKIRQLAELGVHEASIETASKELKRIIKTSDGQRDAILARFGKYIVEDLLPSGEREEYYARFNAWFRNFSDDRARLIVPGKGESLDTQHCVSVGRHATSVGPLEAIVRTERPGVMVRDKVVTRARVLTT